MDRFLRCLSCTSPTPFRKMIDCIKGQFGAWLFAIVINEELNAFVSWLAQFWRRRHFGGCSQSTDKIQCRLQMTINQLPYLAPHYDTTKWPLNATKFIVIKYLPLLSVLCAGKFLSTHTRWVDPLSTKYCPSLCDKWRKMPPEWFTLANILNKKSRTDDKGLLLGLGLRWGLTTPSPEKANMLRNILRGMD
jgi:hypothetical protein